MGLTRTEQTFRQRLLGGDMMADERMTPERVEEVIEQIARVIADFAADAKGLHTIRVTMVRGNGNRCFVDYPPLERDE